MNIETEFIVFYSGYNVISGHILFLFYLLGETDLFMFIASLGLAHIIISSNSNTFSEVEFMVENISILFSEF